MEDPMELMIENHINGNNTTAKEQAKEFGFMEIIEALTDKYGYSQDKALKTAAFLKGEGSFQAACDAN